MVGYDFRFDSELRVGDKVLSVSGDIYEVTSLEIEDLDEPVKIYNYEVEDWHTYFVSEGGILVHNTTGGQPCGAVDSNENDNTITTQGGSESELPSDTKPDFIVTPEGTVMDTNKNYNLVGFGEQGDWFQIHNYGKPEDGFDFPHTHKP